MVICGSLSRRELLGGHEMWWRRGGTDSVVGLNLIIVKSGVFTSGAANTIS